MVLPDASLYCDLNTDKKIVPINLDSIKDYLDAYDKKLEDNAVNLCKERYLCYIRLCADENHDYIKSCCRAEMKKSVSYIVDISLTQGGHVKEAQCECAAGMGPNAHCKHVCALLYACYVFNCNGDICVEKTCTEKLQSFHRVKKYTGSPLKSSKITMPGSDALTNTGTFDPRPEHLRKMPGYSDYFDNICLNFKGISEMPIFQVIPPANTRGVAHDHDYFEISHEDNFLNLINVGEISDQEQINTEVRTRGQSKNQLWYSEREKRIQSSCFGRICKATDRTDFKKLAETMIQSSHKKLKCDSVLHGQRYEKEALKRYETDNKKTVQECGIFVSKVHPFLGASPDGIVDSDLLCEVKCPFSAKNKSITVKTVPYLEFNDGKLSLKRKHDYYFQIQGQLLCSDRKMCDFIVYTLTDVKYIRVNRDMDFIRSMTEKLECFFQTFYKPTLLKKLFYGDY